jgi:hypothetical protein
MSGTSSFLHSVNGSTMPRVMQFFHEQFNLIVSETSELKPPVDSKQFVGMSSFSRILN